MKVQVNGDEIELTSGSTIRDAIEATQAPYIPGSVLGVVKGREEVERHVNKYPEAAACPLSSCGCPQE